MIFLWFKRGATAYEAQFGRVWIRICHLQGPYWKWKPWHRVWIQTTNKDGSARQ